MSKVFLDLSSLFNHRMVYPDDTKICEENPIGIVNNFIKESSFVFDKEIVKNDVMCIFRRNNKSQDNIECENQVLDVDNIETRKITIVGFCSWGFYKENFRLLFDDKTEANAKAYFSDIVWPLSGATKISIGADKAKYLDGSKVFFEFECKDIKGYLYYYVTEFETTRNLKQIIFPDNCFMNIFAITLEA